MPKDSDYLFTLYYNPEETLRFNVIDSSKT